MSKQHIEAIILILGGYFLLFWGPVAITLPQWRWSGLIAILGGGSSLSIAGSFFHLPKEIIAA